MVEDTVAPPEPRTGLLPLGSPQRASFLELIRDPILFFERIGRKKGAIAEIRLTLRRFYLVSDPAVIRELLMTHSRSFEKFPRIDPSEGLFGEGLLTSEGAMHRAQRRMLQPGFHRERVRGYADEMAQAAGRLSASWRERETVNITAAMDGLALDVLTRTLFSFENQELAREIASLVTIILDKVNHLVMPWGSLLLRLPLPSSRRYQAARRRLNAIIDGFIAEPGEPRDDLLSLLLAAADPDSAKPLSRLEIRDQIVTTIVAGHETVATALTWCLYLLARHPRYQAELAAYVHGVLEGRLPSLDDYERLAPVEHAFAEAMRLYPPIWILGRKALDRYTFQSFAAPRGSVFLVCIATLHRNPLWFPDPHAFRPERWCNPDWPNYAYLPFGGGTRRCIGERFAWLEGVLCLSVLLRDWQFTLCDERPPRTLPKLTLRTKEPVRLAIHPRPEPARMI